MYKVFGFCLIAFSIVLLFNGGQKILYKCVSDKGQNASIVQQTLQGSHGLGTNANGPGNNSLPWSNLIIGTLVMYVGVRVRNVKISNKTETIKAETRSQSDLSPFSWVFVNIFLWIIFVIFVGIGKLSNSISGIALGAPTLLTGYESLPLMIAIGSFSAFVFTFFAS